MEKDTVCLSIKEYERLKNFEKECQCEKLKTHTIYTEFSHYGIDRITTDRDAVKRLADKFNNLKSENEKLQIDYKSLYSVYKELEALRSNLNIFKFLKFKHGEVIGL